MRRNDKALYESIMRNVSKQVKKVLNEYEDYSIFMREYPLYTEEDFLIIEDFIRQVIKFCNDYGLNEEYIEYIISSFTYDGPEFNSSVGLDTDEFHDLEDKYLTDETYELMTDDKKNIPYELVYSMYYEYFRN